MAKELLRDIDRGIVEEAKGYARAYLGMSGIGDPCPRKTWLQWRWAKTEIFSARLLRLFDRGNLEEERFVGWLRLAGVVVHEKDPDTGEQFAFTAQHGHVRGHCDGIVVVEGKQHVVEMKTHNNKSFIGLQRSQSVKVSKHIHYCQMQRYMHASGIKNALYLAVSKDNDSLYAEFIKYDVDTVQELLERETELLSTTSPPKPFVDDPGYWLCGFCIFKGTCFYQEPLDKNCRTCKHSEPAEEGTWKCLKKEIKNLRLNLQLTGCEKYRPV